MSHQCLLFLIIVTLFVSYVCSQDCHFFIEENSPKNTHVGSLLKCRPDNLADVDKVEFLSSKKHEYIMNHLTIDNNKDVKVKSPFDRDDPASGCPRYQVNCTVSLSIIITFKGGGTDFLQFKLTIMDVNDHEPIFRGNTALSVNEEVAAVVLLPKAEDLDAGANGEITYTLLKYDSSLFKLKTARDDTGMFIIPSLEVSPLDYETKKAHSVDLRACDRATINNKCSTVTVVINVIDKNDHVPVFDKPSYTFTVKEDLFSSGVRVEFGSASATDSDSGDNGRVSYSLGVVGTKTTQHKSIAINPDSGVLYVVGPLNAKSLSGGLKFRVNATDNGSPAESSTAILTVLVQDINDHAPVVNLVSGKLELYENKKATHDFHIRVSDGDMGSNARVSCRIDDADRNAFSLSENKNIQLPDETIFSIRSLNIYDREQHESVPVKIVCWDMPGISETPKTSTTTLTFTVIDENEFKPTFDKFVYKTKVNENRSNMTFLKVRAVDLDATSQVTYSMQSDNAAYNKFAIDKNTGYIRTNMPLDRESLVRDTQSPIYAFTIIATDGTFTSTCQVEVEVLDDNDEIPRLTDDSRKFSINETFGFPTKDYPTVVIGRLKYTDADDPQSNNSKAIFKLGQVFRQPDSVSFDITREGILSAKGILDRETFSSVQLVVVLEDRGIPKQSSSSTVTVELLDLNDNPPQIQNLRPFNMHDPQPPATVNITDNKGKYPIGADIFGVEVYDRDLCDRSSEPRYMHSTDCMNAVTFKFNLLNEKANFFKIDKYGMVRIRNELTPGSYLLNVSVTDHGAPSPLTSYGMLRVNVAAFSIAGNRGNWTILLIIIVVSTFVTVILVVSIVLLNRNQPCLRPPDDRRYNHSLKDLNGYEVDTVYTDGRSVGPMTTFGGSQSTPLYAPQPDLYATARREVPLNGFGFGPNGYHHPGGNNIYLGGGEMDVASADSGHGASEEEAMVEHRNGTFDQRTVPLLPQTFAIRSRSPMNFHGDDLNVHANCHCSPEQVPLALKRYQDYSQSPLTLTREPNFNNLSLHSQPGDYRSLSRPLPSTGTTGSVLSPIEGSRSATPTNFYTNIKGTSSSTPATSTATVSNSTTAAYSKTSTPPPPLQLQVKPTSKTANV